MNPVKPESEKCGTAGHNTPANNTPALCKAFATVEQGQSSAAKGSRRILVCHRDELPPGQKRIVADGKQSIGVFNIDGRFFAVKNVCPHAGAPLCEGTVHATHQPGEVGAFDEAYAGRILRCPWHGWEFDIPTGKGLYDEKSRVATYHVEVDQDDMVVILR